MLEGADILITGGTGSFGRALVAHLMSLGSDGPRRLIVLSRDELKQHEMAIAYHGRDRHERLRFFIGDVRDADRVHRALSGVDYVVHAAALKQVPACEYNPIEAIKTNVLGAQNIIEAAIDMGVKRVIALSTDKAVSPVNLYGATKLCAEKLFIAANALAGALPTRFAAVRYGNVVGSRGSAVPLFRKQAAEGGPITITDPRMTRFWITLPQAVRFVLYALRNMHGGEVFVPRLPSVDIMTLARAIAPPGIQNRVIGIRQGEKLHEVLVAAEEANDTVQTGDAYVIHPSEELIQHPKTMLGAGTYSSDTNPWKLELEELKGLLAQVPDHG